MDRTQLCLDTNVLIDYLKGREPGASAVEAVIKKYNCKEGGYSYGSIKNN